MFTVFHIGGKIFSGESWVWSYMPQNSQTVYVKKEGTGNLYK